MAAAAEGAGATGVSGAVAAVMPAVGVVICVSDIGASPIRIDRLPVSRAPLLLKGAEAYGRLVGDTPASRPAA